MTAVVLLKRLNTTEFSNPHSIRLLRTDVKVEEDSSTEKDDNTLDGFESYAGKSEDNFNQGGNSDEALNEHTERNDTKENVREFSSRMVKIFFRLKY